MRRRRPAVRLRSRLTLTFAIVAAFTAVTVAAASYAVVREVRLRRATDAAVEQARVNLVVASETLAGTSASSLEGDVERLLQSLQRRGQFEVLALAGGRTFQTSVSLTADGVPPDVRAIAARGRVAAARRTVDGRPRVIVGGEVAAAEPVQFWFFFPLDDVVRDLAGLRRVLTGSALAMIGVSAAVGAIAARRLLRPIALARDAAHRLEDGELHTRLAGEGSDEFAELSRSFNSMAASLEQTVRELRDLESGHRRFVADVSHELRTPVTALAAAADMLEPRLGELDVNQRRAAKVLVDEARRLRTLVEDLMEISRFDAGAAIVEPDLIDLRRLLLGAVRERGWDSVVRTDDVEQAVVAGDRRRLDRVFTNLLDNALRHGAPPVLVSVTPAGGNAIVQIRDHGRGIPADHAERIFDRFYKVDPARGRSSSSGLGLAIARENVHLHGGHIEAATDHRGGAVFKITLPLATVAEPSGEGSE